MAIDLLTTAQAGSVTSLGTNVESFRDLIKAHSGYCANMSVVLCGNSLLKAVMARKRSKFEAGFHIYKREVLSLTYTYYVAHGQKRRRLNILLYSAIHSSSVCILSFVHLYPSV